MTTKIYEDVNTTPSGSYKTIFKEKLIRDYDGRGCWELEVEIPDWLNPYTTELGEVCITSGRWSYSLSEILKAQGEKPAIAWCDESGNKHDAILKVKSRTACSAALYL